MTVIIQPSYPATTQEMAQYLANVIHYLSSEISKAGDDRFMLSSGNNEWLAKIGDNTFRLSFRYHAEKKAEAIRALLRVFQPEWTITG